MEAPYADRSIPCTSTSPRKRVLRMVRERMQREYRDFYPRIEAEEVAATV